MPERMEIEKNTENLELIRNAQAGDRNAMEKLIAQNMGLVKNVAKRFLGRNTEYEDLVQIGTIGMLKAAKSFDLEFGTAFSTYAVPMIIGEIRRFLRDNNTIRVSRSLKDTAYKAIYAKEMLTKRNMQEPTIMEISQEIGIPKEDIVYALDAIQNPMSLYEPVYTEGGDTLYVMDQVSDKKNREELWVEHLSLSDVLQKLNSREHEIIVLRFFEGKTQMEVAKEVGISQAQVSRLEKSAIESMRKNI